MIARDLAFRSEAWLLRAALVLLRALGPVAASNLGGWVARTVGPRLPVSRVAHANLRLALPDLDTAARSRIVRGVWDNLGRTVGELPHVSRLAATSAGPGWELAGGEHMAALARDGGPAILVSGHFANWELLIPAALRLGVAAATIYRAPANPYVDALLAGLRRPAGGNRAPAFRKGAAGARGAFAHLRAGGYLAMLIDQKLNDGIEARLFGRPAMTTPAAASFALRFGCPLVPARAMRLGPARFRLVCDPPVALPDTGDRERDIAALTQTLNDRLEHWITCAPDQWLWLHRRWPKNAASLN